MPQPGGYTFKLSTWAGVSEVQTDQDDPIFGSTQYIDQITYTRLPFGLYLTGVIFTGVVICFAPVVVRGRNHVNGFVLTFSLVRL